MWWRWGPQLYLDGLKALPLMQKLQLETPAASAADDAGHERTDCHLLRETMLALAWEWQTCGCLRCGAYCQQEQPLNGLAHLAGAAMARGGGVGLHLCCFGFCHC